MPCVCPEHPGGPDNLPENTLRILGLLEESLAFLAAIPLAPLAPKLLCQALPHRRLAIAVVAPPAEAAFPHHSSSFPAAFRPPSAPLPLA